MKMGAKKVCELRCCFNCARSSFRSRSNYSLTFKGFTIVELLVVVVVIGILASITIISYRSITNRAIVASLQSDLKNASTQLKLFNISNGAYPTTISVNCLTNPDSDTNKCLTTSGETNYTYQLSSSNNNIYCLTATKGFISYNINRDGQILAGPCPVISLDARDKLSYPDSGTDWYDLSGNDHNGIIHGGVSYSSIDGAMSFDGVDDYVDTGLSPGVFFPEFSGSFWISRVGTPSNDTDVPRRIISARKGSGSTLWAIGIGGFNQLKVMVWNGSAHIYKNGSILSENTIYNMQFVYDDGGLKIYKNGVLDIELTISIPNLSYQTIIIGDLDTVIRRPWSGKIYSMQIGDYVLNSQEVLYNYDSTKASYGL